MSLAAGPWGWGETSSLVGQQTRRATPGSIAVVGRIGIVVAIVVAGGWAAKFISTKPASAVVAQAPNAPAADSKPQATAPKIAESVASDALKPRTQTAPAPASTAPPTPRPAPAAPAVAVAVAVAAATPAPQSSQSAAPAPSAPAPAPAATAPAVTALAVPAAPSAPPAPPPGRALAFAPIPPAAAPTTGGQPAAPTADSTSETKVAAVNPSDQAVDPPPPPRRSIRGGSSRYAAYDGSGAKCELKVPAGYRVGWRIRGGKRTSCYVERIR